MDVQENRCPAGYLAEGVTLSGVRRQGLYISGSPEKLMATNAVSAEGAKRSTEVFLPNLSGKRTEWLLFFSRQ